MSEVEIRIECLRIAQRLVSDGVAVLENIDVLAEKLFEFAVKGLKK